MMSSTYNAGALARFSPPLQRGEPGFRAALPRAGERLHMDGQTGP
jgi:hypothetical protein